MQSNKSLKVNFLYSITLKILNIIFPLVTFPYVARILSPEGIGKIDFSTSIVQYFILLAQVGIPTYAIRECSKFRKDKVRLTKTVQEILVINLSMVLVAYALFLFTIFNVDSLEIYRKLLLIIGFNIFSTSIGMEWFFQSIEEYKYITVRNIAIKLISLVLVFLFIRDENDFVLYAFITMISISGGYIYNFIHANNIINIFRIYKDYNFRRHLKPIILLFAMSLSISIYVNLDKVMLGFISGDTAVGLYTAANKIIKVILAIVTSLGSVLLPRMSYYIGSGKKHEVTQLIRKAIDFIFMISIPSFVGVFMLARPIVLLFAGSEYIDAIKTIRIMSPVILVLALSNLIGIQVLVSHGKEKITLLSTIIGACVNFTINLVLIPTFKQNGAAIGTIVAETTVTIIQIIFAFSYLKNNFNRRNVISYIFGSLLVILITGLILNHISSVVLSATLSVAMSTIIYFLFLYSIKNELVYGMTNKVLIKLLRKH